ncbi:DISARM system SNF2-like helicase DrmD [Chlorogloeopsis sp. ULAP01]|uniref:DISARM system SNF2-like helicase DrmD n=1 Tax=Chlorogloeopsis sp. ULAP01 TaxID=3056483 RepID=UPI0025AA6C4C|nr:DISARM system SNF2-like helicase DrmD [Chlorogloeopsis sp. ULAP01]MDM9383358.1 DISARM system SNF2-like helicase DrmD [Chlorogloeopsis sp. ULAP01]
MSVVTGQIVRVRSRQYLVEDVVAKPSVKEDTLVCLSCLEDDALGEQLEVLWEREVDAKIIGKTSWESIVNRGFDNPRLFSAYLHTLRWNCVTSTDPKLFQAPYRAGIEVKAYQLEPLRKALLMPRVGLFIADDVGLGKTIEAGLILREMLMRQKVRRVVISCPPSVVRQWQEEMESRFGLTFVIFDREFVASRRQERGYGINPWTTHSRFIISHALLRDETYAAPLRDWLGDFAGGSMLILDEAHNAAPASGAKYAVDSQLTRTVRDIAPRFEHKLFLSATPHNGHSNSFAALLEILDPQRFCRGVPVRDRKLLDTVMVRRLKQDLREIGEEFPERRVIPIVIDNLPEDAPELKLSRLLQEYRSLREERLKEASKSTQNAAMLVITSLQKRLLSSIEAFARTLKVHRAAIEKQAANPSASLRASRSGNAIENLPLLLEPPGADDERAELAEEEVQAEEDTQVTVATGQAASFGLSSRELEILEEMTDVANKARYQADPRVEKLVASIKQNICPDLGKTNAAWLEKRAIIFTEYTDTKRYLQQKLQEAIAGSDRERDRIDVFHGGIGEERREAIKNAFNSDPSRHPLRILIATDAAREGVNLQNNCADLFHFDVPWNPSRMEQRNGRIDRKLQRSPVVHCYYFVLAQRTEDKVLKVLVKKTETIQRELGTLSPVVQKNLSRLLEGGIRHNQVNSITASIEQADLPNLSIINEELEENRLRKEELTKELSQLQEMLKTSRDWLGLSDEHFRNAISASLEILGATPLAPVDSQEACQDSATARWTLPPLDQRADPTWANTLDTLRPPRKKGQKPWEWRREAAIRPVVFRDPGSLDGDVVHLHLEHRVVQRLLGRFLAQGFLHDELTRACVCLTDDPIPKVLALGRLSVYGQGASRLHDEVIAIAAEWSDPAARGRKKLQPLNEGEKDNVLALLEDSLASPRLQKASQTVKELLKQNATQDIADLIPHLERRANILAQRAEKKLTERGKKEAVEMKKILEQQQQRISQRKQEIEDTKAIQLSIPFAEFPAEEKRQLEADRRHWEKRLKALAEEINSEPVRIEASYEVRAVRVEPVGLIYLWPVSG